MLSAGHLLDNRYRLDERIATGGMGDVWRGTDVVLGRVVAVKVLRAAMLSDPEFSARFYGEARMMAAFRHPGVVEVYDYASATDSRDDSQCAYLVMAYVEGEPLSTRLKNAGRLGVNETMSIVAQAADALHAAHENGTVHRDVKPGNLIVKPNGTVILVDFGVARSAAVTSVTGLNAIVGTALYMAPEQVSKGRVSPATDIYALGAVAYHCIAGHPPFEGDNALQVALRHLEDDPEPLPDEVPEPVRELITRAMAKNPADRFASAADFADAALEASGPVSRAYSTGTRLAVPAGTTTITRPVPSPAAVPLGPPARRGAQRNQMALLYTVLALLLIAGGVGVAIAMSSFGEKDEVGTPAPRPLVTKSTSTDPGLVEPSVSARPAGTPRGTGRPNGGGGRPSGTGTPSVSATPSTSTVSTTPTATVSTTTTTTATSPTPTTPTDEPTVTDPPEGGGGGPGAGGGGDEEAG